MNAIVEEIYIKTFSDFQPIKSQEGTVPLPLNLERKMQMILGMEKKQSVNLKRGNQ